jgi:hypothetical protein
MIDIDHERPPAPAAGDQWPCIGTGAETPCSPTSWVSPCASRRSRRAPDWTYHRRPPNRVRGFGATKGCLLLVSAAAVGEFIGDGEVWRDYTKEPQSNPAITCRWSMSCTPASSSCRRPMSTVTPSLSATRYCPIVVCSCFFDKGVEGPATVVLVGWPQVAFKSARQTPGSRRERAASPDRSGARRGAVATS